MIEKKEALVTTGGFSGDILRGGQGASEVLQNLVPQEKEAPTATETLKAAFTRENTIASVIADERLGYFGEQEEKANYDVVNQIKDTPYEPYLDSFLGVFNDIQFENVKNNIDKQLENNKILEESGISGIMAQLGAAILDPINLIPIGGTAVKAYRTGQTLKSIGKGAQIAATSELATESILQGTQELRTVEEGIFNVAGGALLGGIIGGSAATLSKKQFNDLSKRLQEDMQRKEDALDMNEVHNKSIGAAEARTQEEIAEGEKLKGGALTQSVIQATKKLNPMLRILTGASVEAKRTLEGLVRTNMFTNKNAQGIANQQSVEIDIKRFDGPLSESIISSKNLYKSFATRAKKEGQEMLGHKQFNDQVALAMIRGDKSDIPEVEAAAKLYRSKVFDPLKNEAIEQGLLPKDVEVKTATSYLMRQYNKRKITAHQKEFKAILENGVRNRLLPEIEKASNIKSLDKVEIQKLQKELTTLNNKITKATDNNIDDLITRKVQIDLALGNQKSIDNYVNEIVDGVTNNIKGVERGNGNLPYDVKVDARGPAKERLLNFVTDEELRPFLETDIEVLARNYTRTLATDTSLKRAFGDLNLKPQIDSINQEYSKLIENAKSKKEADRLETEQKEAIQIINALKDILRGHYGRVDNPDQFWPRANMAMRMIQYMSKLGGVVISSIADAARHTMIHGYNRVFGTGIKNLITNISAIKMNIQDARVGGNVLETITHSRAALYADIANPYSSGNAFEKILQYMSDNFSKVTGLDYWNNIQKGFSSVLTQNRMIENLQKFDDLSQKEMEYMAFLGIDSSNAGNIIRELKKHGSKDGDILIANLDKWTNSEAKRVYVNALNTDVDRTIVTKGVGDVPLFMNKELGKTIGQFKSFAFAAHQQVLIAGMQQGDAAALSGTITMIGMGMLVYYLKTVGAGRELSDDPKVWLAEGIDRSGLIPVITEANGVADVFGVGAGAVLSDQPLSRYASRNRVIDLAGPSVGATMDLAQLSMAVTSGEITKSDVRALRKNIPYQNVFYLRSAINKLEEKINDEL